jgi:hypothetical protein
MCSRTAFSMPSNAALIFSLNSFERSPISDRTNRLNTGRRRNFPPGLFQKIYSPPYFRFDIDICPEISITHRIHRAGHHKYPAGSFTMADLIP